MSKDPADLALERLRTACFALPAVEEKTSHGSPSFFVRGKMFASFADDHHGSGHTAAWCKTSPEHQAELVAEAPSRYFVPPYVGVKGWTGVHLDAKTDWDALAVILESGWDSVAPKSARDAPVLPPPRMPALAKTDPGVSKAALERLLAICAELEGSEVERDKWYATFRVKKKPYLYFNDNHHGDGIIGVSVKVDPGENAALIAANPKAYYMPAYIGPKGWLGIRLDQKKVDWKDVTTKLLASYAAVAPKPKAARRS